MWVKMNKMAAVLVRSETLKKGVILLSMLMKVELPLSDD